MNILKKIFEKPGNKVQGVKIKKIVKSIKQEKNIRKI